jgi:hypothetical protein
MHRIVPEDPDPHLDYRVESICAGAGSYISGWMAVRTSP